MNLKQLLPAIILVGVLSTSASAASIYAPCTASAIPPCSFNLSGIVTVTGSTITWRSDQPGNAPNLFTLTGGQNVFSVIPSGSQESIQNLNIATEPVGAEFGPFPFISFPNPPGNGLPGLNVNFIFPGIYSSATCAGTPAVGQTCTPLAGGSPGPFNFVNNPPGPPSGPQATATFVLAGVTADNAATWQANFTSQFFVPFQTVLGTLDSAGAVQNSYSATTKVTITIAPPVPEPGTLTLVTGAGAVLLLMSLRRRIRRS